MERVARAWGLPAVHMDRFRCWRLTLLPGLDPHLGGTAGLERAARRDPCASGRHLLAEPDPLHLFQDVLELVGKKLEIVLGEPKGDRGAKRAGIVPADRGLRPGAAIDLPFDAQRHAQDPRGGNPRVLPPERRRSLQELDHVRLERPVIYKGLLSPAELPVFYADLREPAFQTPFAVLQKKISAAAAPLWSMAPPLHTPAHNGELRHAASN